MRERETNTHTDTEERREKVTLITIQILMVHSDKHAHIGSYLSIFAQAATGAYKVSRLQPSTSPVQEPWV